MKPKGKVGRPLAVKPKSNRIQVRLDDHLEKILDMYCQKYNVDRSEAIRTAIKLLCTEFEYFLGEEWDEEVQHSRKLLNEAAISINKLVEKLSGIPFKGKGDHNENENQ